MEKSDDEDFLVTYSALANTSGLQIVPEDKVSDTIFVLDFSMTMNRYMNNTNPSLAGVSTVDGAFLEDTRIYTMLNAMDETIETLRKANSENRVGIVTFYGDAKILLPLTKLGEVGAVVGPTGDTVDNKTVNYTTPNKYFSILGYTGHGGNNNKSWVQCNIPENPTINELSDYTSMQSGVYEALDMFREELSDETLKERQANVVVITDGESNTLARAVEEKEWYEELRTDNNRSFNVTDFNADTVFATILTASYLKEYVGKMYAYGCKIYTVGLLEGQDMTNMQSLLDPGRYLDEESKQPQIITAVLNLWNQYNSSSDPYPTIGEIEFSPAPDPNVEDGILPSTLDYADAFYNAENASQLANAFQEITSNLIVSNPKPPTETGGGDSTKSGYITFTDPLGKYMEVKDVKCIIFDDQKFEKSTKKSLGDGKTTCYTFSGAVDNPASLKADVKDILIDVTQTDDAHQTVKIQIPASVVPLRSNTVYLKSGDSTPIQLTTNEHYPMRIVYSVGLQDEVTQEWLEENDQEYLTKNKVTDATGNSVVNFYANLFDGDNIADGTEKTLGNATATFTADTSNPFYYAQKGSVLYIDEYGKKVPATGTFVSRTTYYVKHDYYYWEDNKLKHGETWLGRSDLTADNVKIDEEMHQLVLKEDMLKQVNLASARTEKTDAVENTADYSYYAKALDETEQVAKGSFLAYLGNNGKLSLKLSDPEEPLTILVEKVWQDENNKDGIRPGSVTVELIKNGTATGETLTLNDENDWKDTFIIKD